MVSAAEFNRLLQMVAELREEVKSLRNGIDNKIDTVAKSVKDAFQGFGILDPEEDTWTEQQVCERYNVSRRTMYNRRSAGVIPYNRSGKGKNCAIRYRKADVIEMFASENA